MTAQQRKYAVKLYQRRIEEDPNYSEAMFYSEIAKHFREQWPNPKFYFDPFSLKNQVNKLWVAISMDMKDVVKRSGMNMRQFSDRFFIPYRTLQAWCDETNPCPLYTKLLLCDALGYIPVDVVWGEELKA